MHVSVTIGNVRLVVEAHDENVLRTGLGQDEVIGIKKAEQFVDLVIAKAEKLVKEKEMAEDNWKGRSEGMMCMMCMWFVAKRPYEPLGQMFLAGDERVGLKDAELKPGKVTSVSDVSPPKTIGRCRRHAPSMHGWPVMFGTDWCGDHKLDEEKV